MLTTGIHTYGKCPKWGIEVAIFLKYSIREEDNVGCLLTASCPIVENLKLPEKKRGEKYKYIRFSCDQETKCDLVDWNNYPQYIDPHTLKPLNK